MKTSEALTAFRTIQKLIDQPTSTNIQFRYALIKNKRLLEAIIQQYNARISEENDPVFDELIQRWRELAMPVAELQDGQLTFDSNGNIAIMPDKVIEYNLACEEVLLERQDYQDAFNRRNELIVALQQTEMEIQLQPIGLSLFPNDTDFTVLEVLYPLIDGDH